MGINEKIVNAKSTTWVTDGLAEKEVRKIIKRAIKKIRKFRNKTLVIYHDMWYNIIIVNQMDETYSTKNK